MTHATQAPAHPSRPLMLGTVALGLVYGDVVRTTLPSEAEARAVLQAAWDAGIDAIDTARVYGVAEERIGRWMADSGRRPRIITKVPRLTDRDGAEVDALLAQSLATLGVPSVEGCLVHWWDDLSVPAVAGALRRAVDDGRIGGFGASVYAVADALAAMELPGLTLLQMPASLLDRRAAEAGVLARAADRGVRVYARSVYTQGILFVDPDTLPVHFDALRPVLRRLRALSAESGIPLAALALREIVDQPGITAAVLGLTRPGEVADAVAALAVAVPADVLAEARALTAGLPEAVVNPAFWPR